jgi:hypothetical protein
MADAETLRLIDPYAGGITYLDTAEEYGRMLRLEIRRRDEERAVRDAILAARYAFRAVPGLRGGTTWSGDAKPAGMAEGHTTPNGATGGGE